MYSFGRWILCSLFLGHLIAGVNREVLSSFVLRNSVHKEVMSTEAWNIMRFQHKISDNSQRTNLLVRSSVSSSDVASHTRSVPSTFGILCHPLDSCESRCGHPPRFLPYTCNCDALCHFFLDCCIDYEERCGRGNKMQLSEEQKFMSVHQLGCEILYMKYNLLTVNQCPEDHKDKLLCTIKMPNDCIFSDNFNASDVQHVFDKCKQSVRQNCVRTLRSKCNEVVEPQCTPLINKKCYKHASAVCRKCNTSFWPVFDNGIIYKNSYCALCNSQANYTLLSPFMVSQEFKQVDKPNKDADQQSLFARLCAPGAINSCPKKQRESKMQDMCHNHSAALLTKSRKGTIYKNVYCALCNGEKIENLVCATKAALMRGLIRPMLENFITGDIQGMNMDDIPAAFSILLNFGLDGRERMYFSSEGEEEMKRQQLRCGEGRIWDPFSEVCRKLYCSTEFVLIDYRCVRQETPAEEFNHGNETAVVPDARAEFVHLTLSAEMEMLDFLQFNGLDIETICESVRESLADSFGINIERVRNVQFNISVGDLGNETSRFIDEMNDSHLIIIKFDFDLYEDDLTNITMREPSVDSIVSMLASSLSMNGFEFDIKNTTSRIFEIHQTVSPLTSWCNSEDGGEQTDYWNSEFSLILNEETNPSLSATQLKGIYVNQTGKFYPRGKFIADILFQGYQFSGSLINVSGVAVVCNWKTKLNESCIRILIDHNEYVIENGSLLIHNESLKNAVDYPLYEEADNGSIYVCIKSLKTDTNGRIHNLEIDIVEALVSYALLWISVIALAIVLITYIAFGSLRNLPGCNTMNLTFSLLAMQLTFIFGQKNNVVGVACVAVAHLLHYEILCCFVWMNVMAFDLFRTFGNKNSLSNIRSKSKFLPRYMAYAYFAPLSVIAVSSLLDYFQPDSAYAPHYGIGNACWIYSQKAALVFFATPLAVIMCINFVFFVLTILAMISVKSVLNSSNHNTNQRGKNDVFLYGRMALVIGLTWALSFAAAYVEGDKLVGQILRYLFIICNTLQGVFIFWVFVCNKRVYGLYKDAFRDAVLKLTKHAKKGGTPGTITRLANAMKRTVSTDTVISTISNSSTSSNESQLSTIKENVDDFNH